MTLNNILEKLHLKKKKNPFSAVNATYKSTKKKLKKAWKYAVKHKIFYKVIIVIISLAFLATSLIPFLV